MFPHIQTASSICKIAQIFEIHTDLDLRIIKTWQKENPPEILVLLERQASKNSIGKRPLET